MDNETLADIIQSLIEFLTLQVIAEHYIDDGRGVFFVQMQSNEIRYIPQDSLPDNIPDANALKKVMEETEKYDHEKQICIMVFAENEVFFQVAEILSGEENPEVQK